MHISFFTELDNQIYKILSHLISVILMARLDEKKKDILTQEIMSVNWEI